MKMSMTEKTCTSCRQPKANLACGACEAALCKQCVETLEAGSFSFLEMIPDELSHRTYCRFCYEEKVAPALEKYNETLERAKECFIFFTTQRKEIPLIRRSKVAVQVENRTDRDETILQLGFFAAEQSFNAV